MCPEKTELEPKSLVDNGNLLTPPQQNNTSIHNKILFFFAQQHFYDSKWEWVQKKRVR